MSLGPWWAAIATGLLLLLFYGAGAAGPLSKKSGRRIVILALLFCVALAIAFVLSPDSIRPLDWTSKLLDKLFGKELGG
jgi:MFS family permease